MSQDDNTNLYAMILGLPDHITEPDHYELLGLPHLTNDIEAIREAAVVQNGKFLKWQNSKYFPESQRIHKQVVEAMQVLQNPETKREYDQQFGHAELIADPEDDGLSALELELLALDLQQPPTPKRLPRPRDLNDDPDYWFRREQKTRQREQRIWERKLEKATVAALIIIIAIAVYSLSWTLN